MNSKNLMSISQYLGGNNKIDREFRNKLSLSFIFQFPFNQIRIFRSINLHFKTLLSEVLQIYFLITLD